MIEKCSFCGKKISQVVRMIRSPQGKDVYICDECINLCKRLIDKEGQSRQNIQVSQEHTIDIKNMSPRQIHDEFSRRIIGQEYAKRVLSVALYNHNKRLHDTSGLIKKSNILLAGPSGCGKTLFAMTLAKMLNVPFAAVDATSLTEAGYVGDDVEVCIQRLLEKADGDIERAKHGIIYIDEIDKIARVGGASHGAVKDVSGEGVQSSLLKLVEGCEVSVPAYGNKKVAGMPNIMFDTRNVLFICGGAFESLFNTVENKQIGFNTADGLEVVDANKMASEKLTEEALKKYGIMPELIGRLPVLCAFTELNEDELIRVLTEPEEAITKEYQLLFEKDNIKLTYEEDALREVAKKAIEKRTGARGLRSILEEVMLDIMYEVPEMKDIKEVIITKDTISTKKAKII